VTGLAHYLVAERLREYARAMVAADDSPDEAVTAAWVQRRIAGHVDVRWISVLALLGLRVTPSRVMSSAPGITLVGLAGPEHPDHGSDDRVFYY
jgi:hypothetical protein